MPGGVAAAGFGGTHMQEISGGHALLHGAPVLISSYATYLNYKLPKIGHEIGRCEAVCSNCKRKIDFRTLWIDSKQSRESKQASKIEI